MNRRTTLSASSSTAQQGAGHTEEWQAAERRVAARRHRGFKIYVAIMVAANALVVAFWVVLAIAGRLDMVKVSVWPDQPSLPAGFFWPVIPIVICSVLVWLSARRAYPRDGYPAEEIDREMHRNRTAAPVATDSAVAAVPPTTQTPRPVSGKPTVHEARRVFAFHMLVYVAFSAMLIGLWAAGGGGFFWPVFVMTVWGLGVLLHAYLAFRPRERVSSRDPQSRSRPG